MREIKFRAWNITKKEMLSSEYSGLRIFLNGISVFNHPLVIDEIKLMQYTGLKDKNGVEIYEGDIIQADNGNKFRIVFFDGAFQVARLQERIKIVMSLMLPVRNKDIAVIGNIYENKELLND